MIYGIFIPQQEPPISYMYSESCPSFEDMGDHLAERLGFPNRDDLLRANPGLRLAALTLQ